MSVSRRASCWASTFSFAVLVAVGLGGCAPGLPAPTSNDVQLARQQWEETTLSDLQQGRDLYVRKCSGCHTLFQPDRFDRAGWTRAMPEMARQAGIDVTSERRILRYLLVVSGSHLPSLSRSVPRGQGVSLN